MDQEFLDYLKGCYNREYFEVAKDINNYSLIKLFASSSYDNKKLEKMFDSFHINFKDSKELENIYINEEETNKIMEYVFKNFIRKIIYTCYHINRIYENDYQTHLIFEEEHIKCDSCYIHIKREKHEEHYPKCVIRLKKMNAPFIICDCGGRYKEHNLEKHLESNKHLEWVNNL